LILYKEKLKVISYPNVFNIVARGGGGFDFFWRQVEGNIPFNKVFRGGRGVLIPYKRKLKVISH